MYIISMDDIHDIQNLMSWLFPNYAPAWSSRWESRTWRGLYKQRSWLGGGKRRRWSAAYGGPRENRRCIFFYTIKIVINVSKFIICWHRTCEEWSPCSSQNLISFFRQSAVVHLLNIVIIIILYIKLFVYYQNVINVITKPSDWRSRA